jgi:hypothetical protein
MNLKCESGACIQVDVYEGAHLAESLVRLHSTQTSTVLQARASEWIQFVEEIKAGHWDYIAENLAVWSCAA